MKSTSSVCCSPAIRPSSSVQTLRGVSCVRGDGRITKPASTAVGSRICSAAEPETEVEMLACLARLEELVPAVSSHRNQASDLESAGNDSSRQVQLLQHVIDYILDLESTLDMRPDNVFDETAASADRALSSCPPRCSRASSYDDGTETSDDDAEATSCRLSVPPIYCGESQMPTSMLLIANGEQCQTKSSETCVRSW